MSSHTLESLLRPPVEIWSAGVAILCAAVAIAFPWALMMTPTLGLICAAGALALAAVRMRAALRAMQYQQGLRHCKITKLAPHRIPVGKDDLYLGEGFQWTQVHTQRKADAMAPSAKRFVTPTLNEMRLRKAGRRLDEWAQRAVKDRGTITPIYRAVLLATNNTWWWNPIKPFADLGGNPIVHGVGLYETPVKLRQSERNGHMLVLGTTRVGKTRLLEVLATQDIHAGHVTIVIDPKGDADLMLRMYAEAKRAGRLDQFYVFHLGYPEISARYNGIANFERITEVATRATNALPSGGNSAAFKEFSWRFTNLVAQAQVALGRVPTYDSLLRDVTGIDPLFQDYAKLVLEREAKQGRIPKEWQERLADLEVMVASGKKVSVPRALQDRPHALVAMVLLTKELKLADPVLLGLSAAVSYEKSFFEKIIASLGPFLEKLTTGSVGKLISPDYFDVADTRPIFDWMQVIRQGGIVYVGLDALADAVVSSAVGNTMLADLVSVGGKLYKSGIDPHHPEGKIILPKICCHFDEVNEIAGPEFVPMVNKLGGSGFQITAYSQAVQDIEAKVGDRAKAEQILANFNHVVMLRVRSQATAKFFAEQVPEVDVTSLTMVSGVTDAAAAGTGVDFTSRNEDRVSTTKVPMITTADIMEQPKGQAFALLDGNRLFHFRIPFPDASNDEFIPESLRSVAKTMKERYRTSEQWWLETDWLNSQPVGGAGHGVIATHLAVMDDEPPEEIAA